jgi:hypothetical protein
MFWGWQSVRVKGPLKERVRQLLREMEREKHQTWLEIK